MSQADARKNDGIRVRNPIAKNLEDVFLGCLIALMISGTMYVCAVILEKAWERVAQYPLIGVTVFVILFLSLLGMLVVKHPEIKF